MTEKAFILLDIKNISRDFILIILLPVPLLLALILRLGFSALADLLRIWFDLETYAPLILMFILNMGPLLIGMIGGLLFVDEADDHVLPALAVTPPGRRGFLMHRLGAPYFWTALVLLPVPLISGLTVDLSFARLLPLVLIVSLGAPLESLIIAVTAHNKIEAMAVGKMTGILFMAPFIAWFAPGNWKYLGAILPGFWVSLAGFSQTGFLTTLTILLPALLLTITAVLLLLRRYERRID
jgi:fluoroquinolone transport system permease protein